ncbi:MAG: flavin reductase [Chloroflexi bacterium]|nr:flavin reductase [Chloroflexota bacterium]
MAIDPLRFRKVIGNFATGVTVLTTVTPVGVYGMTANAVTSLSLEPTLVLVCIDRQATTHDYVQRSKVFALNILSEAQQDLSRLFARPDSTPERALATVEYEPAASGSPILRGALAYLDCRVVAEYPGGDHTIFVGEVDEAAVVEGEAAPLIFFRGQYRSLRVLSAES